jgi:hypothetical protein
MKVMENSLFVLPDRRDGARSLLEGKSELVWSCEAESHFEAMTKYYTYQEWRAYTTEFEKITGHTLTSWAKRECQMRGNSL